MEPESAALQATLANQNDPSAVAASSPGSPFQGFPENSGSGSGSDSQRNSHSSRSIGGWLSGVRRRRHGGRRPSRQHMLEREQFDRSRQEAMQDAMMEVSSVYYTTMLLGFIVIGIATFFEVKSVYVLVITYGQTCDRPLWYWLLGHILLGMLRELSWQPLKGVFLFFHVVWTFYGFLVLSKANTCRSTSPELYEWVEVILMIASVFLAATTLLPVTFYVTVMVLVVLVNRGMISNQKAAREGTLERLQVVDFDPDLFAPPDHTDDPRPAGECCCCTELFDTELAVVRTPCGHYYHRECLGDWLKLARTCPLCRCDLEEAVWSSTAPP